MSGARYSPFLKDLAAVDGDDLLGLKEVAEGWFVDYKSQPLKPVAFGKIISSFANQFGGWLFIGISEGHHKSMKAESFPGIPSTDVPNTLVAIREGVSAHVSTPIFFDHKIINGPVASIALPNDQSIIVISIPEGDNPPYIHSSGRIYRRVADSAEPKPETDRSVLDSMWRKSERVEERLRDFLIGPSERHIGTSRNISYLFLFSDPTHSQQDVGLNFQEFRTCVRESSAILNLDHIYHTQDGYIARHLFSNDPYQELVSLRWFFNGNARITLPISSTTDPGRPRPTDAIYRLLLEKLREYKYDHSTILDMGTWSIALIALIRQYLHLRERLQIKACVDAKIVIHTGVQNVPYIPMEALRLQMESGGIPVSEDNMVIVPQGTTVDSFLSINTDPTQPVADIDEESKLLSFFLVIQVLRALGMGIDKVDLENRNATESLIKDYFNALSVTNQRNMN